MITPEEIRKKLLSHWRSRRFLKADLGEDPYFPLTVPFKKPGARELLEKFDTVRAWLRELKKGSRSEKGYGYDIEFTSVNHRSLGPQLLPSRIVIPDRENFLRLIGRERDYRKFQDDLQLIQDKQPQLLPFAKEKPGRLLDYGGCWPQLLAVSAYFLQNPRAERYLRELDIRGVDSKFIEQHRRIVGELLDQLLPASSINQSVTGLRHHGFERRYYLKYDEALIRFRILDPALSPLQGISDLSLPLSQFRRLNLKCQRVIITENKINGLSFPACPGSVVIFGLGYGIRQLQSVAWLHKTAIWYWGDIDTHGFAILSRLRGIFAHTKSFLMNSETLRRNSSLWGREEEGQHCDQVLQHLTPEEERLYNDLQENSYGTNIRLEQERISYAEVCAQMDSIGDS